MKTFDASKLITGHSLRDKLTSLMHDVIGIDQSVIECFSFRDNGAIFDNELNAEIGDFKFVDDALPVVGFRHKEYMKFAEPKRDGLVPMFIPQIYNRHSVGMQWRDEMAPPELHNFLMCELFTIWMDRPGYKIRKDSHPFFQGGSHGADEGWFYVEFLGRRDVYKTVAWINENFRYPV